jgi:ribonuclease P protein component
MLPKPHRLPSPRIREVFEKGKRIHDASFQLILLKNDIDVSRFAVLVPVRIDKRATIRNRMRRIVREAIRHLVPEVAGGWDVVVMVKKDLSVVKQTQVLEQLHSILARGNVLRG